VTHSKAEDKSALVADMNIQKLLTAQGEGLMPSLTMAYAGT
jgi:hypothetical protein